MDLVDPATGCPLPADAIQRVLFVASTVHVYSIPPLASMRGHSAASWTADPQRHIFTARLRVIETSSSEPLPDAAAPAAPAPPASSTASPSPSPSPPPPQPSSSAPPPPPSPAGNNIKVDLVLEDASSAAAAPQLFAAAPYTSPSAVEPVVDSSRFFAVTVRDPAGRKAVLGIGFEERSEAFDLAVALQEARRLLALETDPPHHRPHQPAAAAAAAAKDKDKVRDYSLKEGETITVNLASKLGRRRPQQPQHDQPLHEAESAALQSFALPPPPSSSPAPAAFALPPPPSAEDVKRKRRSLREFGFDDGQFGEFA